MTPVCLLWGAIGLGDLVAAPGGETPGRPRAVAGVVVAALAAALGTAAADLDAPLLAQLAFVVGVVVVAAVWLLGRERALTSPGSSARLLVGALVATCLGVAAAGWLGADGHGAIERWLAGLPYAAARNDPARAAVALSIAPALVGTANAAVRLALAAVRVQLGGSATPDRTLRGGRLIGPIERLLVFGFALAGQPTAASLIIAAKGLLRYPELSTTSRLATGKVDEVSEYLLVGSLVSWTIALAPLLVLPGGHPPHL